jgi:hypothetical protein
MMFQNLTFNSILWLIIGVALIAIGAYVGMRMRMYPFTAGLVFLGIGSSFCGWTNGFTDYSPTGRLLWKVGIPILLLGLLLTGYGLLKLA